MMQRRLFKKARGRRRHDSDMIFPHTESGIVLAFACLIHKHYINIIFFCTTGDSFPLEKGGTEFEQMLKGTGSQMVEYQ